MTNPTPTPPVIPTNWTPQTIITYVASLALFVVGILTLAGLTIPSTVSTDVQLYSGLAITAVGPIVALIANLSHNKLISNLVAAGVDVESARRA